MPHLEVHDQGENLSSGQPPATTSNGLPRWGRVPTGYRLPNPLPPFLGESLPGLIMRNAGKYQLQDPCLLLSRLSPPPLKLHTLCRVEADAPAGKAMRELLGVDEEAWRTLAMGAGASNLVRLNGHRVSRELVRLDQRHVCPQCLAAAPFHRASWFLDAIPVCPEHRSRLLADCPRCRSPLGWHGTDVHLCGNPSCSFDLRRAPADAVPEEELGGAHALTRLLMGQELPGSRNLTLPFGEALRLAILFGQLDAGLSIARGMDALISRERHRIHEIVDRGWRALDDWPHGFHRLLDSQVTQAASRPGKTGLRKLFGYLSARIYAWQQEAWGKPIAEAFALYVSSRPDMPITAHVLSRFGSEEALKNRNLTLADASRTLDVSGQTMVRLAERHDLYLVPPVGSGLPSLLSAEKVAAMRTVLRDALLFEEGRQIVGVGRPVLEQLEESGLIRRVAEDRVVDSQVFRRSEIESFVAACRGAAPSMTVDEAGKAGLATIAGMARGGRTYPDICRALVEGRLLARGLVGNVTGLGAIRLLPEEVRKALPMSRSLLSAVEVGRHLGVAHRFVRHWTARGFLASAADTGTGQAGLRYRMADVDRFLEEFMPGGEVAEKAGTPGSGTFARHMRFLGIHPVSGPMVDGCDGTLFRRADITPKALAAIAQRRDGEDLTLREQRARCSAQVHAALAILQARLGPAFKRVNNRLEDGVAGRVVQVISGRRQSIGGTYRFKLNVDSLDRLLAAREAHVALVPDLEDTFIYAPLGEAMTFATANRRAVGLRFDPEGRPLDLAGRAIPLTVAVEEFARQGRQRPAAQIKSPP